MPKRLSKDPPELDITAFLNLMVVLVPFLLITAVFSRITVLQLNLPEEAGAEAAQDIPDDINIEVIVRNNLIELSDGEASIGVYENLPNPDPDSDVAFYDWNALNYNLSLLRQVLPDDKTDATILMEDAVRYNYMVQAMDSVRLLVQEDEDGAPQAYSLFPDISFGDAP